MNDEITVRVPIPRRKGRLAIMAKDRSGREWRLAAYARAVLVLDGTFRTDKRGRGWVEGTLGAWQRAQGEGIGARRPSAFPPAVHPALFYAHGVDPDEIVGQAVLVYRPTWADQPVALAQGWGARKIYLDSTLLPFMMTLGPTAVPARNPEE